MKRNLLETIFLSEKRKLLLLLLEDSPKTIEYIVDELKTSRQGLLPQIKILTEQKLITKNSGTIQLTHIGRLLVGKMKSIVNTVDILENNYEYWTTRDFSAIPTHLFEKINDLCPCIIAEPKINEMFEFSPAILNGIMTSKYILACASFIHPSYPSIFHKLSKKGTETSVILTENAIKKLESDFRELQEEFIKYEHSRIYAIKELNMPGIIISDNFILLWLFNEKGNFEPLHIISQSETAINWGKELFEHYRNKSISI
jgi:predicted transcriptional regulator